MSSSIFTPTAHYFVHGDKGNLTAPTQHYTLGEDIISALAGGPEAVAFGFPRTFASRIGLRSALPSAQAWLKIPDMRERTWLTEFLPSFAERLVRNDVALALLYVARRASPKCGLMRRSHRSA